MDNKDEVILPLISNNQVYFAMLDTQNNLFIQNFVASIVSIVPPYLEFSVAKYQAIKKAMFITAHDLTPGSYLEFGVFTGSSFNFAMKANKRIEKIFGKTDCEFIGFDSFSGFGEIKKEDDEEDNNILLVPMGTLRDTVAEKHTKKYICNNNSVKWIK